MYYIPTTISGPFINGVTLLNDLRKCTKRSSSLNIHSVLKMEKKCTFGAKTESLLDNAPNYLVGGVIKKRLHFLWDFFALWTMNHLSAFRPIWSALIGQLKKHLNPIVTLNGLVKVNLCIQLRIFLHIQLKLKRRRCVCNANGGVIVITQGF